MRILILEDIATDAELIIREIRKTLPKFDFKVVETKLDFEDAVTDFNPNLIISDYNLPSFNGLGALKIAQSKVPFVPFIIVTGPMNEDVAVSCMKAGADDYVIKGHIKRLGEAIIAAMNKKENEFKRKEAENELRKTLEELQKSRNQLRELNNRIQQVREKERKEISREIHDVIGQSLTALKYDVFWVGKNVIKTEEYSKKIEEMDILISETIQFTQKLSSKLRPELIDTLGFKSALTELLSEFEKRTHIKTKLYFPQEFKNFDPDISMTLFRITQECLTNVARHAKADKVKLVLKKSSSGIYFIISDNGIGISQEKITNIKSLGLLGITERVYSINSNIEIIGKDNKGTNIIIHVPKERIKDNTL